MTIKQFYQLFIVDVFKRTKRYNDMIKKDKEPTDV